MSSFDDFVVKAKNAASAAGKKTGEMFELSKLKLNAAELRSDIDAVYARLGRIAYHEGVDKQNPTEMVKVLVSEIDELAEKLSTVNEKISQIKKVVKCPNCGTRNDVESFFCTRCGTSLPKTNVDNEEKADNEEK